MVKDYIEEIKDSNNIILRTQLLIDLYEYKDEKLIEELGENYSNLVVLTRDVDADLDDDAMVDCSTYSLGNNNKYIKDEEVVKEIWHECENLPEYRQKYLSY